MPRGELDAHVEQLPEMIEILSGGSAKLEARDDED